GFQFGERESGDGLVKPSASFEPLSHRLRCLARDVRLPLIGRHDGQVLSQAGPLGAGVAAGVAAGAVAGAVPGCAGRLQAGAALAGGDATVCPQAGAAGDAALGRARVLGLGARTSPSITFRHSGSLGRTTRSSLLLSP